jgi:hypothetical protein
VIGEGYIIGDTVAVVVDTVTDFCLRCRGIAYPDAVFAVFGLFCADRGRRAGQGLVTHGTRSHIGVIGIDEPVTIVIHTITLFPVGVRPHRSHTIAVRANRYAR